MSTSDEYKKQQELKGTCRKLSPRDGPRLQAEKAPINEEWKKGRTAYDKHIRERQSVVRQIREAAKQLEAETKKVKS